MSKYLPEDVLLTNTREFGDDIGFDFLRRGPPLDIPETDVAPAVLGRCAGSYESAPGRAMVVRLELEGWLTLQTPDNVRFRMYAESDRSFFLKRTPWRFAFTRDTAGQVTAVVADLEGTERRGQRFDDEGPAPTIVAGNAVLDLPLTADQLAPYVGTYELPFGDRIFELRVFVEDGRLMGQPAGSSPSPLLYQGDHAFVPEAETDMRLVFRLVDGRAEGLTVTEDDERTEGRRKQ